jgi:hypothetical protein
MNSVGRMSKHRWTLAAVILCIQCGGATPPAEEAPGEPSEALEETPAAPPEEEAAGSEDESGASDTAAEDTGKSGSSKKSCAELPKQDCQVTQGCAWNDLKKCVEEGAAE